MVTLSRGWLLSLALCAPAACGSPERDARSGTLPAAQSSVAEGLGYSAPPQSGCVVTGCAGEVCASALAPAVMTACVYQPQFECYKTAQCVPDETNQCAWRKTPELDKCLHAKRRVLPVVPQ